MASERLKTLLAPSVGKHIAGGFAVLLVLLVALAGVTLRLILPIDAGAARVRADSANAEVATAVSLDVSNAHVRVVQYALSATMADQKVAQDSLTRLDQAITASAARDGGGRDDAGLAALAARYRRSADGTFAAVGQRRAAIERIRSAGTDIRTIASAIGQALESETDPDLVRGGARLVQGFQESDAASSRFLASRNPADSNIAADSLASLPVAAEDLVRLAGDNRRIQRFVKALKQPLAVYAAALQGVVAADDQLQRAAVERNAASEAVLGAAVAERDRATASQREAVGSMLGSVGSVRRLLLLASLAAVGIGLALTVLISRGISHPVRQLTRATQQLAEGNYYSPPEVPTLFRRGLAGPRSESFLQQVRTHRHGETVAERIARSQGSVDVAGRRSLPPSDSPDPAHAQTVARPDHPDTRAGGRTPLPDPRAQDGAQTGRARRHDPTGGGRHRSARDGPPARRLAKDGAPLARPLAVRSRGRIGRRAAGGCPAVRYAGNVHAGADLRDHGAGLRETG